VENVWDYPRPPALVPCEPRVRIELGGVVIADSGRALRILETSHPPTIYIPRADVADGVLTAASGSSWCEWKGRASYLDARAGDRVAERAAWFYPAPAEPYGALLDHVSFYPGRVEAAWLDDERVQAQAGGFYGGWITSAVTGPFKGAPGTTGW
jgi:uncharacterized protein (DUF427 family)